MLRVCPWAHALVAGVRLAQRAGLATCEGSGDYCACHVGAAVNLRVPLRPATADEASSYWLEHGFRAGDDRY